MRQNDQLAQFLREEVKDRVYADLLIERAKQASAGNEVPGASGNAYHVAFGTGESVIEHHYLEDWPALRLPHRDFIAALMAWRKNLAASA